jgi:putative endopeptidase
VRTEYGKHLKSMFQLLGEDTASVATSTAAVLKLETALAARSRTLEELRDPWANYHKLSFAELAKLTPTIDWKAQFDAMGVPVQDTVIVGQPEFFRQLDSCLSVTRLSEWQAVLRWNVTTELAPTLSHPFDQENFRFYSSVLQGVKTQRARWKRMLDATEDAMGDCWARSGCSATARPPSRRDTRSSPTTSSMLS